MRSKGWESMTLGDFVALQRGHDLPESKRRPGNVPVIGSFGITGYHDIAKAKGPGVTIGRSGASFGVVSYSPVNYWPHNAALYVTDFYGNDERFSYYFLKSIDFKNYNSGSAQPSLNRNYIYPIEIKVPPLPIQRKIAAILSAYDDLIENNTRRIEILEEMARSIYREWFVKFRFPGHEQVQMVDSELGPIPEGWEAVKVEDVVELAYGKSLTAKNRIPGTVPVYGSAGVVGYHNESLVNAPGVIVGRKGNVGSVFWSNDDFFPIDTVFYVQTKVCLHYVYYNLQNQNFINNDAAVPGLNRNQAYSLPFLLPSENLLKQFQHFVDVIFKQTSKLRIKNDNLRQTRDLLLPRLISSEIDVENLDINISQIAA